MTARTKTRTMDTRDTNLELSRLRQPNIASVYMIMTEPEPMAAPRIDMSIMASVSRFRLSFFESGPVGNRILSGANM